MPLSFRHGLFGHDVSVLYVLFCDCWIHFLPEQPGFLHDYSIHVVPAAFHT